MELSVAMTFYNWNAQGGTGMLLSGLTLVVAFGLILSIVLMPWAGRWIEEWRFRRREARRRRYYARKANRAD